MRVPSSRVLAVDVGQRDRRQRRGGGRRGRGGDGCRRRGRSRRAWRAPACRAARRSRPASRPASASAAPRSCFSSQKRARGLHGVAHAAMNSIALMNLSFKRRAGRGARKPGSPGPGAAPPLPNSSDCGLSLMPSAVRPSRRTAREVSSATRLRRGSVALLKDSSACASAARAVAQPVDRAVLGVQAADGAVEVVGHARDVAGRRLAATPWSAGVGPPAAAARQRRVQPGLDGAVERARQLVGAGGGLRDVLQRVGHALLVVVADQLVDALGRVSTWSEDRLAAVLQLRQHRGLERNARRVVVVGRERHLRFALVVQRDEGQAGHALVAQRGEARRRERHALVDRDAHPHVALDLGVEADRGDLADGDAAVAHRRLRLQAADGVAGGELVGVAHGVVAREPDHQRDQHGDQRRARRRRRRGHGPCFPWSSLPLLLAGARCGAAARAARAAPPWRAGRARRGNSRG